MPKSQQTKEIERWKVQKPFEDELRKHRGVYHIPDEEVSEYKKKARALIVRCTAGEAPKMPCGEEPTEEDKNPTTEP